MTMSDDDFLSLAPLFDGGGEAWWPLLRPVLERQPDARTFIGPARSKAIVPVRELTFQALKPNPPARWRVVVFGQNPYPRVESATGIAMFDNAFRTFATSMRPGGFLRRGQGRRMMFEITPRSAVSIKAFSAFTGEDEYVLAPGTRLSVDDVTHDADGLTLVRLTELPEARLVS